MNQTTVLENDRIMQLAPSVFATQAISSASEKYRFLPTISVVNALRDMGYGVVRAQQSRTLVAGNREFAKHMLRFRHVSNMNPINVGDEIPEIVLTNSHNGSSVYNLMLGIFRLVCSNGMVVASENIESMRVRHSGSKDLLNQVIEVTGKIVHEAPKVIEQINRFKSIPLTPAEQEAFGSAAMELSGSSIELLPTQIIRARRTADMTAGDGSRSLWATTNVIQENLIRGGQIGKGTNGRRQTTRTLKNVQKDIDINKALWKLTEELAKIKTV